MCQCLLHLLIRQRAYHQKVSVSKKVWGMIENKIAGYKFLYQSHQPPFNGWLVTRKIEGYSDCQHTSGGISIMKGYRMGWTILLFVVLTITGTEAACKREVPVCDRNPGRFHWYSCLCKQ